jgi:hypothetical protein
MDGTGDHCVKWNKAEKKVTITCCLSKEESRPKRMNDKSINQGDSGGGKQWEGARWKERVKGGEFDQSTSYTCMKIE